ncbi:ABC transporter ATP-binding protein [Microvirga sp. 3-52]|uniref:ABC transporter ATP-binding protein n=1 Tax=Microvirga sp. 3-52 TaxID=2792425 RepID=UPI001AC71F4A|nr:ABC transporter ATP-binding protein [Microvirga sp. 3-52]MBO1903516.1 ABC transporter ATP-binding protein [Microvirga sp. 3-52]MBS7450887.1 ABC transporter ATP-binding protein [Microvirga sp. 3-52]
MSDTANLRSQDQALLSVRSLSVEFGTGSGAFKAVKDISFDVQPGRTLAVVGESGSGKSVTSLAIMRLTDYTGGRITGGQVLFRPDGGEAIDLVKASDSNLRQIRGNDIAMIFQEPMTSLNPVFTIGNQISETLILHQGLNGRDARLRAKELLQKVRLPDADKLLDRYPHQLSGGMRQRVMIAMALACNPKLLIADEPTTALDVTIQAQILHIIRDLQQEMGTAVIFITHDMGVVAEMADDVVVMWKGEKVEKAPVRDIFAAPQHPYTRALLSAVPRLGSLKGQPFPKRTPVMVMDGGVAKPVGDAHEQNTADYTKPILQVEKLTTRFDVGKTFFGRVTHRVHAVEEVNFDIYPGETLALVGESGSGKSTIGRTLQQLVEPTGGTVRFDGRDMAAMSQGERRRLRQEIQYIFQDPFASLDPRHTAGYSVAEPIIVHGLIPDRKARERRVHELLEQVGLQPQHAKRYPHEFSGGQRQRICIARALASNPKLVIADESVSALDVSIQAQIVNLLMELQEKRRLSYLFITHDMAVVERISHRVAVMYLGQIVELGPRQAIFENPQHSYTRKLLSAVPIADPQRERAQTRIEGEIPSPVRPVGQEPAIHRMREVEPGHWVAIEADQLRGAA